MLRFKKKNKFIQTQALEKRDALLKPNIGELDDNDDIFCPNIIDYYQNRPDFLEGLTLAAFAADYEYFKILPKDKLKQQKDTHISGDDALQEDDNNEDDDTNVALNSITLKKQYGTLKEKEKAYHCKILQRKTRG